MPEQNKITSQQIAQAIGVSHPSICRHIAKRLRCYPVLLDTVFTRSSFIDTDGKPQIEYAVANENVDCLLMDWSVRGWKRLREQLDALIPASPDQPEA